MGTDQIVLIILAGISTTVVAVIGFFLKSTLTDFKVALKDIVNDMRDLQGWRSEHTMSNRTNFKALRSDLSRCQKAIKRIRVRLTSLEGDDDDS